MTSKKLSGRRSVLLIGGIILLGNAVAQLIAGWGGGPVYDFISAALPWVSMAVGIACFAAGWTGNGDQG